MQYRKIQFSNLPAELRVYHPTYESAREAFPNCERAALRAFARSEAARLANKLISPRHMDEAFSNVVALFADVDVIAQSALRQRRFDFVIMLLSGGKFERKIARRLIRQGKISAEVLA